MMTLVLAVNAKLAVEALRIASDIAPAASALIDTLRVQDEEALGCTYGIAKLAVDGVASLDDSQTYA